MKQPKTKLYPGTQAIRRAIALLKSFTDEHPRWGLNELARHLGLNKTTVFRMLFALEKEGLVVREEATESYVLGPDIVVLAGRALRSGGLHRACRPELEVLVEKFGETSSLEVLSGYEVMVVDEIPGDRLMAGTPSVGMRWPAFATSTGKAMMAYLPEGKLNAILRKPMKAYTSKTITNPETLRSDLESVSKQGYAVADEQLELGFIAVGAAVRNHGGEPVAAISVGGPTLRLTLDRIQHIGSLLRLASERVSLRLGYSPK